MEKPHQLRTTFGSWDVEKVHAVVVWSTFRSQNVETTPAPDHFWKLRCRESARRCGAKHISKSKVQKTEALGALFVKSEQNMRVLSFCSISKNDGRGGAFEEDLQILGNIGWRLQEGLGTSFSRERIDLFWVLNFETYFCGFLNDAASCYSWSISKAQVVSWSWIALPCAYFFEKLHVQNRHKHVEKMIRPGPQEHRSLSVFFSFSRLVTCDYSVNFQSRTWGIMWVTPQIDFFYTKACGFIL